tara:strand:- start:979 stop:1401 length:423 start_codon:yes stop_codon:yes gene_type:complete
MRNLLLSVVLCLAMSFSFAQSEIKTLNEKMAKKNVIVVVDFLTKNLKLDSKQKAICMNAYSEYANAIIKGNNKVNKMHTKPTMASRKQMQEYVLRFSEKRNKTFMPCLNKKQAKQFSELQRQIDPRTLEVRERSAKKKKN